MVLAPPPAVMPDAAEGIIDTPRHLFRLQSREGRKAEDLQCDLCNLFAPIGR